MADISKITLPDGSTYDFKDAIARVSIPFGQVDSTSTTTAFTATIPEITEYYDGLIIMLKNGVVTSAEGFTININGLGAKHVYTNMAAAIAETTIFNVAYTMLFIYDSTRVEGGGWICYRGYDSDTVLTKVSQLTNDAGYLTLNTLPVYDGSVLPSARGVEF